jgi:uncharacterized phage protein gp47/JayE
MPFGVTSTGFTKKTFDDIEADIIDYQRENIDSGLVLSADTNLGQENKSITLQLAELWEVAEAIYASFDPDTSSEWALDKLASLTGTLRNKWTKTTVTARVTLNPNKSLPAGSVANLSGRPNDRFVTTAEVAGSAGGGDFDAYFEAEEAGPIEVGIGQLTEISEAVSGWTAVNNLVAGDPGSEPEEDPDFRDKREDELTASGSTNLDAIVAGVSRVSGVVDVIGKENDKDYVVAGLPPHSVEMIIRGGANPDIAQAIFVEKSAGIDTYGGSSEVVTDSQNNTHTIFFTKGTSLVFYCDVEVETNDDWNGSTSIANIKTLVEAYINALGLGDDVIYDKVKAAVLDEPGVLRITSMEIDFSTPPASTTDLSVLESQFATADVANINVSVTP